MIERFDEIGVAEQNLDPVEVRAIPLRSEPPAAESKIHHSLGHYFNISDIRYEYVYLIMRSVKIWLYGILCGAAPIESGTAQARVLEPVCWQAATASDFRPPSGRAHCLHGRPRFEHGRFEPIASRTGDHRRQRE